MTFHDSFLYTSMSLRDLKKSYGLQAYSKGFFPHKWNQSIWTDLWLSHLPPAKDYDLGLKKAGEKAEFEEWYNENKKKPFPLMETLVKYCQDDTILLFENVSVFTQKIISLSGELHGRRRCQKPMTGSLVRYKRPSQGRLSKNSSADDTYFSPVNLHPFSPRLFTLPSIGYAFFRTYCLTDDFTVPSLPNDIPSVLARRSSKAELEWLMFLKQTTVPDLLCGYGQHQQPLFRVGGSQYYVDGYSPLHKRVYEYLGCHVHGKKKIRLPLGIGTPFLPFFLFQFNSLSFFSQAVPIATLLVMKRACLVSAFKIYSK